MTPNAFEVVRLGTSETVPTGWHGRPDGHKRSPQPMRASGRAQLASPTGVDPSAAPLDVACALS